MFQENTYQAGLRAAFGLSVVLTALWPQVTSAAISVPPSLISPANGISNVPLSGVTFSWSATAGANSYRLVVSQDPNFSGFKNNACDSTCFTTVTAAKNYAKSFGLTGQQYYWKVLANNVSSWSLVGRLNTTGITGKIIIPTEKNQKWTVCQGYNSPSVSHKGTLINSFDLSLDPKSAGPNGCISNGYKISEGQPIYAPVSGNIVSMHAPSGVACIRLFEAAVNGANSVMVGHFPSLYSGVVVGQNISKGARIGTLSQGKLSVLKYDDYAHLHLSSYFTKNCTGDSVPFLSIFDDDRMISFSRNNLLRNQWSGTTFVRIR